MKNKLSLALRKIVKERDSALWRVYEKILGIPFPAGETEIHHVKPHGEGGEDREENLILLNAWTHRTVFHKSMGHANERWKKKALDYLTSEEVRAWRGENYERLKRIYAADERSRIKRIRKKCLPKKRKGLPF